MATQGGDFDLDYASVDALAEVGDEAETRALEAQVARLSSETIALRAQVLRSEGLASKLEARKAVLRANTMRLFEEAKALVDERDAVLRRLRMSEPVRRSAPVAAASASRRGPSPSPTVTRVPLPSAASPSHVVANCGAVLHAPPPPRPASLPTVPQRPSGHSIGS